MAEKKKNTDIDLSKYEGGFKPTEALNQANALKTSAEAAVKNYGDFSYGRQGEYDNAMNAILNRKGFSYDLNGDALYQQYKDNYITQGKQAMMDAAGQAAAMTGGYGNSYAQTVGQQTYQGYLQGLNDKIPELYQLALDRYNSEGDRLATNYGLLSSDRSNALAEHEAGYNKLVADRDYYGNEYNSVYNREFTNWDSNRTYDTSQYWNEYNTGYQAEQYAIANERAAAQLAETIRANKASEDLAAQQFAWQKSQGNVSGTPGTPGTSISSVPDSVISKLEGIKTDAELEKYLDGITGNEITAEQADTLYATYKKGIPGIEEWELVDNGGVNGFLGIGKLFNNVDDNAKAKFKNADGTYTTYRMDDLSKYLQNNGYSKDEAIAYIKKLQTSVGIN